MLAVLINVNITVIAENPHLLAFRYIFVEALKFAPHLHALGLCGRRAGQRMIEHVPADYLIGVASRMVVIELLLVLLQGAACFRDACLSLPLETLQHEAPALLGEVFAGLAGVGAQPSLLAVQLGQFAVDGRDAQVFWRLRLRFGRYRLLCWRYGRVFRPDGLRRGLRARSYSSDTRLRADIPACGFSGRTTDGLAGGFGNGAGRAD